MFLPHTDHPRRFRIDQFVSGSGDGHNGSAQTTGNAQLFVGSNTVRRQKKDPVSDNVISYIAMCQRERTSLQQGMNVCLGGNLSVILMSVRPNAPYRDRLDGAGTTLVREGHDMPKSASCPNPKVVDQPLKFPSGDPTQNGKFDVVAQPTKFGTRPRERVRVYEKIRPGIWSYSGMLHLVDSWTERAPSFVPYASSNLLPSKAMSTVSNRFR